jgi:hypothetical protein
LFLRKLTQIPSHRQELEEDDLRAEHYAGFRSPGLS